MPTAASSLERPAAMAAQNRRRASRPAAEGRPGERNGARPDRSERRFCLLIATPSSGCCDDHLSPGDMRHAMWLSTFLALLWTHDAFAQKTASEIRAYCLRVRNSAVI